MAGKKKAASVASKKKVAERPAAKKAAPAKVTPKSTKAKSTKVKQPAKQPKSTKVIKKPTTAKPKQRVSAAKPAAKPAAKKSAKSKTAKPTPKKTPKAAKEVTKSKAGKKTVATKSASSAAKSNNAAGALPALLWDGPTKADRVVVLAHGASGGMHNAGMTDLAKAMVEASGGTARVLRFQFPPGFNENVLLDAWRAAVIEARKVAPTIFIGGRSMGGRMASYVASDVGATALACFGFPFRPPWNPSELRIDRLKDIKVPTLIVQGERDNFGGTDLLEKPGPVRDAIRANPAIKVAWVPEGDHGLVPLRKSGGNTRESNLKFAAEAAWNHFMAAAKKAKK
jgi:predicted alpha/beta-hydrolase family hydrolase